MNASFFSGPTDEYYLLLKWDRSHTDSTTFHVYRCKHWETLFTWMTGSESFIIATSLNSLNSFQHMCPKALLSITEKSSLMIHWWQLGQSSFNSIWRIGNYQNYETCRRSWYPGSFAFSHQHFTLSFRSLPSSHSTVDKAPSMTGPWMVEKVIMKGNPGMGHLMPHYRPVLRRSLQGRVRGSEQGPPQTHTPTCTPSLKPTASRHMFADPGSMMPVKPEMEAFFSSTPRKDREAGPEQRWERIKR